MNPGKKIIKLATENPAKIYTPGPLTKGSISLETIIISPIISKAISGNFFLNMINIRGDSRNSKPRIFSSGSRFNNAYAYILSTRSESVCMKNRNKIENNAVKEKFSFTIFLKSIIKVKIYHFFKKLISFLEKMLFKMV